MFFFFNDTDQTVLNLRNLVSFKTRQWETDSASIVLYVNHSILGTEDLTYSDNNKRNEDLHRLLEALKKMNNSVIVGE